MQPPQVSPNEANPWRGIETIPAAAVCDLAAAAPNEANPWRGIETINRSLFPSIHDSPPNEANPWRGIETGVVGRRKRRHVMTPRMKLIPGEGLKHGRTHPPATVIHGPRMKLIPGEGLKPYKLAVPARF